MSNTNNIPSKVSLSKMYRIIVIDKQSHCFRFIFYVQANSLSEFRINFIFSLLLFLDKKNIFLLFYDLDSLVFKQNKSRLLFL